MTKDQTLVLSVLKDLNKRWPHCTFNEQDIVDVTGFDYDELDIIIIELVNDGYIIKIEDKVFFKNELKLTEKALA